METLEPTPSSVPAEGLVTPYTICSQVIKL